MAQDNYNKVVRTINSASKLELNKSYHFLSKDLPPTKELNCTYSNTSDQVTMIQDHIQALNDNDMVTNMHMPDLDLSCDGRSGGENNNSTDIASPPTPEEDARTTKCDGAYVSIDDCIELLLKCVCRVVIKKGGTMEEAMKDASLCLW